MLINSYLKNIMDRPSTDINTMTDVTDNGILYIPNEPTLQCIAGRQLPCTNPDDKYYYDVSFEAGFLEIKNTKNICTQIYTTKTNKFKRFKATDTAMWSKWTLSYSTNNRSTSTKKGVMNEALVKSYILKNYIKYDPTELTNLANTKVNASLLSNKITRSGDTSTGTIGLASVAVYNGDIHFYGNGWNGIYSRSGPGAYIHSMSIGPDNYLRTGSHSYTRTVFESVNRPRIVMPGVVDKGAILIASDLEWKSCYWSGNVDGGTTEVGLPAQAFEYRSWNRSGYSPDNFAGQYHFANGSRIGANYDTHLRSRDHDDNIEHSVMCSSSSNRIYVTWNQADDCRISMVLWR